MKANVRVVRAGEFGTAAAAALLEMVGGLPSPVIGLPTGNTPGPLYAALRELVERGALEVASWRPIAIDEYGGPSSHPCSNRAYFEGHWDVIPGARPVLQFDPEADDLDRGCGRVATAVTEAGGLDVAILGVGMNGHLAFNEPGSFLTSTARRVELQQASMDSARECWGEATPTWGLTLGLGELLGARSVLVIANGAAKAGIVRQAVEGPISEEVPASLVRTATRHRFLLDDGAASRLLRR